MITDLMAERPRLNLNANHFKDSYKAETECLQKKNELIRTIIRL